MPANVARDLRALKNNRYADTQRDAVAELTASQIEAMAQPEEGYGVLVEGSGHQTSNFNVRIEVVQISQDPPETASDSPAPTQSEQAPTSGDAQAPDSAANAN